MGGRKGGRRVCVSLQQKLLYDVIKPIYDVISVIYTGILINIPCTCMYTFCLHSCVVIFCVVSNKATSLTSYGVSMTLLVPV